MSLIVSQQPVRGGTSIAQENHSLSTPVVSMQTPANDNSLSTPVISMATPNLAGPPSFPPSAVPPGFTTGDYHLDSAEALKFLPLTGLAQQQAQAALLLQQQQLAMGLLQG